MIELSRAHAVSTAAPAAFFARWVDHATWHEWSPDTEWVRITGPVEVGARGALKPVGGPKTRFIVSACAPEREYTDTTLLPGARLVFAHTVLPSPSGGSELDVRVTLRGPLARLWAAVLGGGFRASVPADLARLVALVEAA